MNLTLEIISFAVAVLVLNVLDSVTTELCFKQYPDKELKGEGNPFMRRLMLKNRVLAEVVKQAAIIGIVIYFLWKCDLTGLRLMTIAFGIVVLNNAFIVISRAVTKRKVISPIKRLVALLHMREKFAYLVVVNIILLLTLAIHELVWGLG
jgi:hypothetical protein